MQAMDTSQNFGKQALIYKQWILFCYFQELHAAYKGAGERSVESAANLVGLKLPELPENQEPGNSDKWRTSLSGVIQSSDIIFMDITSSIYMDCEGH